MSLVGAMDPALVARRVMSPVSARPAVAEAIVRIGGADAAESPGLNGCDWCLKLKSPETGHAEKGAAPQKTTRAFGERRAAHFEKQENLRSFARIRLRGLVPLLRSCDLSRE